ncbi:MAG: acetyltransferase [Fibrobacterales bacterium]
MSTLYIAGGGGHGKVVAEAASLMKRWTTIVFLDDNPAVSHCGAWPVSGTISDAPKGVDFIVAIGNNSTRHTIYTTLIEKGLSPVNIIHPKAIVSPSISLGRGIFIAPGAIVNIDVTLGNATIINTGATVDHDSVIGPAAHICPGVNIAGEVTIGAETWVGIGSCTVQCITIGKNVMIGAGSIIRKNVDDNLLLADTPKQLIRNR